MIWPILEAKTEIQKYFRSFFGSNEDIQQTFWNYLTFSLITLNVELCETLGMTINDSLAEERRKKNEQQKYAW